MGILQILKIFIIILFISANSYAQDMDEPPYNTETGIGLNLNTNGGILGGAMFKRSIYFKKNQYHLFALEIVNVKHPKEQRVQSGLTGNTFIYYKQNYFFVLRPQYGREFLLFHKSEDEGVRVNGLIAAGPSLGILKPYAIDYNYSANSTEVTDVLSEPFDPEIHTDPIPRILGTGGILTGASSSKFIPGLNLKAALNFELGTSTTGVEAGFLFEVFPKKINIMAKNPSSKTQIPGSNVFTSIYINIYFSYKN